MQHQPAPDRHDIEAALTRPRNVPQPAQEVALVAEYAPEPAPVVTLVDYTPTEHVDIRRRWAEHFAQLCVAGERALWLVVIFTSFALLAL